LFDELARVRKAPSDSRQAVDGHLTNTGTKDFQVERKKGAQKIDASKKFPLFPAKIFVIHFLSKKNIYK
jgi:hypothetical protein